jgi:hypothetical protein
MTMIFPVPPLSLFLFFCRATLLGLRHAWILMVNRIPGPVLVVAALTLITFWFWIMLRSIPFMTWILSH